MSDVTVTVTASSPVSVTLGNAVALKDAHVIEKYVGDGGTKKYTMTYTFRTGSMFVFKNGQLIEKDVDYTEDADREFVTLTSAPSITDKIEFRYVED